MAAGFRNLFEIPGLVHRTAEWLQPQAILTAAVSCRSWCRAWLDEQVWRHKARQDHRVTRLARGWSWRSAYSQEAKLRSLYARMTPAVARVQSFLVTNSFGDRELRFGLEATAAVVGHLRTVLERIVLELRAGRAASNVNEHVVAAVRAAMMPGLAERSASEASRANVHSMQLPVLVRMYYNLRVGLHTHYDLEVNKGPSPALVLVQRLMGLYGLPEWTWRAWPNQPSGAVAITAVLEYIALELLELSGRNASCNGQQLVTGADTAAAVAADLELSTLLKPVEPAGRAQLWDVNASRLGAGWANRRLGGAGSSDGLAEALTAAGGLYKYGTTVGSCSHILIVVWAIVFVVRSIGPATCYVSAWLYGL